MMKKISKVTEWENKEVKDGLGHSRNLQGAQILEWRGGEMA